VLISFSLYRCYLGTDYPVFRFYSALIAWVSHAMAIYELCGRSVRLWGHHSSRWRPQTSRVLRWHCGVRAAIICHRVALSGMPINIEWGRVC